MENYNTKSCNALEKPFYRPTEAALRWCGLIAHEAKILAVVVDSSVPGPADFPQWPCLRANAEKILDAMLNDALPYGRDGRTVTPGEQVAKHRLTIRHSDLKAWMAQHYPDQKPAFLFDEIERNTHAAYNADSFRALQADRDALKARIEKATEAYRTLKQERDAIAGERDSLRAMVDKALTTTERNTLLTIIAALCDYSDIPYQERGAASKIAKMTEEIGVPVTDDTIRNVFVKISDALESRKK